MNPKHTYKHTYASGTNTAYLESMYADYKQNPSAVDSSLRDFFEGYEFALGKSGSLHKSDDIGYKHSKVEAFVNSYRRLGHLAAHLDPLNPSPDIPENMTLKAHGLEDIDPNESFRLSNFVKEELTLEDIIKRLRKTYCGFIGADFREINSIETVVWLQEKMESCQNEPDFSAKEKQRIFKKIAEAENFEKFLHTKYLGQKRFSLEGLEALLPLLDTLIEEGAKAGLDEICMGMAHRGRLNVLANIMQKPVKRILFEFEGSEVNPFDIDGDVKYHQGFGSEVHTESGQKMRLFLAPNPSHLEAVNPIVEGFARSRQDLRADAKPACILPILLHGDAAFVGQGVVSETLNLSQLPSYQTQGTIHIITNNQIGFTTNPEDSRSCPYSSDISKIIRAPVFHVNADEPLAVVWVAKLALMFRQKFARDVVIDLVGYRRHGHNETDEPGFTQPQLYDKIAKHPSVCTKFAKDLLAAGSCSPSYIDSIHQAIKEKLNADFDALHATPKKNRQIKSEPTAFVDLFRYKKASRAEILAPFEQPIHLEKLRELALRITKIPAGFNVHSKLKRILSQRVQMIEENGSIDWAFAELLAFASLADMGHKVRLSGQDCKRGTFSSRHAVLVDTLTSRSFNIVSQAAKANIDIINSPLSEMGCLGFEFGYSLADPNTLTLWEAQFGDFVNGAQVIIDQFLIASEAKWQVTSGLVLLLPHGYEGQGPEHSSARPERFLQCAGNYNIQVANVTTPAQLFHLLRRQILRPFRKPLVLMTPKSLLRHPSVVSKNTDFTTGCFKEILEDKSIKDSKNIERLILCTGKIFYELEAKRTEIKDTKIAIVRIEQLYPFASEEISRVVGQYKNLKEILWVQEEPRNMGAWSFLHERLLELFPKTKLTYVGRKKSGSTAEGSGHSHKLEQARIIDEAFGLVCAWNP